MLDGTKLNVLSSSRQMLQAFGGLNETYGCSEAELSRCMNFSSRGYPALQTRKPRRRVREVENLHGAYHLNGMLLCRGTGLEYTPDDGGDAVVLEDVLTDDRKQLVGMGTKVLIWPDKKAFDTAAGTLERLEMAWTGGSWMGKTVTVCHCDADGNTYTPTGWGEREPAGAVDGQIFLKCDPSWPCRDESVLERYDANTQKWVEIVLDRVKLTCRGIGAQIQEGDTLALHGMDRAILQSISPGLDGYVTVHKQMGDSMVLELEAATGTTWYYGAWTLQDGQMVWTGIVPGNRYMMTSSHTVTVTRSVPELDFVTECNNRIWGCRTKDNSIYACKLGDPTNWYSYQGTAADSYAVGVGSDGPFTGAATCLGYVLFFKETCIHRLYGTKPSEYRVSSVRCRGVAANAANSLCVLNEGVYYLSNDGVMLWDGSLPTKVSAALNPGPLQAVEWTAAGYLDMRYYLYVRRQGAADGRLLVYDTEKGLWHEESAAGREMVSTGRQLYLWDGSALWAAEPDREADRSADTLEQQLTFEAVSGDIGLSVPEDKYVSRVTLRVDADGPGVVTAAVSYDGRPFEKVASCAARGSCDRMNLPFEPHRFDTMRVKLTGKGKMALRSMALTLADSSGGRVQGAEPRR